MILPLDEQTIIAQCTPRGSGAIALLRISGADAILISDHIAQLPSGKKLSDAPTHTIHYANIYDTPGCPIDHVMITLMRAPKTFTGQDTVEITCHNNQFIVEQIISLAITAGARLAQEGEFSKRAVINGKIDLVQAEAINELIHAQTQLALKKSLAQLTGSFSYWIASIEKELLKALALCQASFEFLDEEMEFAPQIHALITSVKTTIASVKKTFNQQQQIRQGIRIAIIGSVNAGKSSLFNALLNQERAIVTAIAGTTRDVIEAGIYTKNNYWTLVDTAGLRQTEDSIEQEGIRRSFQEAHTADIIILAYDSTCQLSEQEAAVYQKIHAEYENKIIAVVTKMDENDSSKNCIHAELVEASSASILRQAQDEFCPTANQKQINPLMVSASDQRVIEPSNHEPLQSVIPVSSKTKKNIAILEQTLEQKIAHLLEQMESPFLLNQRQHNLLLALEKKLDEIESMVTQKSVAYELLAIHLNDALAYLTELSGKAISEAGMDMVFREFCIGK